MDHCLEDQAYGKMENLEIVIRKYLSHQTGVGRYVARAKWHIGMYRVAIEVSVLLLTSQLIRIPILTRQRPQICPHWYFRVTLPYTLFLP